MRHPFINPRISAAFEQDEQHCPGIGLTLVEHTGKAALGPDSADQRPDLKVGGKAGLAAQPAAACIPAA